jgi:hypothetical protein
MLQFLVFLCSCSTFWFFLGLELALVGMYRDSTHVGWGRSVACVTVNPDLVFRPRGFDGGPKVKTTGTHLGYSNFLIKIRYRYHIFLLRYLESLSSLELFDGVPCGFFFCPALLRASVRDP